MQWFKLKLDRHKQTCFRLVLTTFIILVSSSEILFAQQKFQRVKTQFIAALGDPDANSGDGAEKWGVWRQDPGPRGVWLRDYTKLVANNSVAPMGWRFDAKDWWLDENGLLMEKPSFPLPPGRYIVTGDREAVALLTIYEADKSGNRRWTLSSDVKLFDVTHLPCRSARYSPSKETRNAPECSPAQAPKDAFKVPPGQSMPPIPGCHKQDYAVLFVVGIGIK